MSLQDAKLLLTPNAYKASKLYAIKPIDGTGDPTVTRNTTKTRVNSSGLIESNAVNVLAPDYLNGVCPALNVEGQRTNKIKQSEAFDSASWSKSQNGTGVIPSVTANSQTAPDGTLTAERVTFNLGGGTTTGDQSILNQNLSGLNTVTYSGSIYLKGSVGGEQILFRHVSGGYKELVLTTEWKRYDLTEAYVSGIRAFELSLRGGIFTSGINDTCTIDVWGGQLEEGSEPSSYIPTTTAQVTRSADTVTIPIPAGTTEIIEKYEDGTTNTITTIPASPYTVPTGKRYEYILMR